MNAWSHLPNAPLIDWVIASLKTNPRKWTAALNEAWYAAGDAGLYEIRDAAGDPAWDAMIAAARHAAWDATWDSAWCAARNELEAASPGNAARDAIWDVILVLVAYDDCDQYLQMSYEMLLAWALLSETPQAILLLPLKWMREHEALVAST